MKGTPPFTSCNVQVFLLHPDPCGIPVGGVSPIPWIAWSDVRSRSHTSGWTTTSPAMRAESGIESDRIGGIPRISGSVTPHFFGSPSNWCPTSHRVYYFFWGGRGESPKIDRGKKVGIVCSILSTGPSQVQEAHEIAGGSAP